MIKDNEELAKQQVLFNDIDTLKPGAAQFNEKTTDESTINEQIIFDNDDYAPSESNDLSHVLACELNQAQLEEDAAKVGGKKNSWLWRIIIGSFLILLVAELVDFFSSGFETNPLLTAVYALFFTAILLVSGHSLWRELVGLKQFKLRQKEKNRASALLVNLNVQQGDSDDMHLTNKPGKDFCETLNKSLPCDLVFDHEQEIEQWHHAISNEHSSAELVQIYSRVVLSKVDEKALNEISKFSTEAVVLIALSPIAILDMFILLSRNLRMINKVAGLYGLKLGYWSRIKLIKQVFVNMAYAGASELIADFGTDMLGAELLGKLSARFAQGLGAGLLTARLGAKAMELCRPIPFEQKPKLTQVKQKIVQQIQSLITR